MSILHVVTLVDDGGAFGGPVSVALGQLKELRARGHDVRLAATCSGLRASHLQVEEIPTSLFPALRVPGLRFSGLASPAMVLWLRHRLGDFDVVHVHAGRDLVSLTAMSAAAKRGVPYVAQTHGMIVHAVHPLKRLVDRLATHRLLSRARAVLVLQDTERAAVVSSGARLEACHILPNGIELLDQVERRRKHEPVVLFCARLHPRKRVGAFLDMARELLRQGISAQFRVVGPDDGDADVVRAAVGSTDLGPALVYLGGLTHLQALAEIADADVLVLPSVDEPYGMVLLEAMSRGVACVCTTGCHIAADLERYGAAIVSGPDPKQLASAVAALLRRPDGVETQGRHGWEYARSVATIGGVVDRLEEIYKTVMPNRPVSA